MEKERFRENKNLLEEEPLEEKHFKDIKAYWDEIMNRSENDDIDGVQRLLLQRGDFSDKKLPGEDEIWQWLKDRVANNPGQELLVELNEKCIIVPKLEKK